MVWPRINISLENINIWISRVIFSKMTFVNNNFMGIVLRKNILSPAAKHFVEETFVIFCEVLLAFHQLRMLDDFDHPFIQLFLQFMIFIHLIWVVSEIFVQVFLHHVVEGRVFGVDHSITLLILKARKD